MHCKQPYLRNNTDEDVTLTAVPLVLFDANQNMIARRVFDMKGLEVQAKTAIPYQFDFYPEHMLTQSANISSWEIGFHMRNYSISSVISEFNFETSEVFSPDEKIEEEDRRVYSDVQRALMETEGQVGCLIGRVDVSEEGDYSVLLLIRNGRENEVQLANNIPIALLDGIGEVVAEGQFDLSSISLPPQSVVPYTITYPASAVRKAEPDLSGWSVAIDML